MGGKQCSTATYANNSIWMLQIYFDNNDLAFRLGFGFMLSKIGIILLKWPLTPIRKDRKIRPILS